MFYICQNNQINTLNSNETKESIKKLNNMNKYDKMDYTEFVSHLKENNIKYIEEVDVCIDYWFTEYQKVTPLESKLKERYFDREGGIQLTL